MPDAWHSRRGSHSAPADGRRAKAAENALLGRALTTMACAGLADAARRPPQIRCQRLVSQQEVLPVHLGRRFFLSPKSASGLGSRQARKQFDR
jgi:hypothetical protein